MLKWTIFYFFFFFTFLHFVFCRASIATSPALRFVTFSFYLFSIRTEITKKTIQLLMRRWTTKAWIMDNAYRMVCYFTLLFFLIWKINLRKKKNIYRATMTIDCFCTCLCINVNQSGHKSTHVFQLKSENQCIAFLFICAHFFFFVHSFASRLFCWRLKTWISSFDFLFFHFYSLVGWQ